LLPSSAFAASTEQVTRCIVTDGDTIRCKSERIHLVGIDALEVAGHCRNGRACAPGNGLASKRSLSAMLTGRMRVDPVGRDRYGRTLAIVHAGGVNLSCRQIERRQAIYKPRWDTGNASRPNFLP
jgi:micrococcal nuclease